jgi:cellulose synthase/poly-beta-1,6-N-acetylglucosamine synthase-like glycosyltransferase
MSLWIWVSVGSLAILLWTWVLYPASIWLIARVTSPAPRNLVTDWPSVSCILATRDDVTTIAARVEDFFDAQYPADRLQVVVGVDGATVETLANIRRALAPRSVVVVAADAGGGKAAGLNAAVREATGDVLVFSDAQQRFATDAISVMVTGLLSDARLAMVGGALQLPGDRPEAVSRSPVEWYWRLERQLRGAEARLHSSVGVSGSIYSMWRRAWLPMPTQLILDDVWLPMRLVLGGSRVGYALDAKAWDARSTTAAQEKVRKVRTLTGNFQLVAWLPALLLPIKNPIWLQFVSHKLLRLVTPWVLIAFLIGTFGVVIARIPVSVLPIMLIVIVIALTAIVIVPKTRFVVQRGVQWGWSLQTAVVQATLNGLRGRWDVWQ